MAPGLSLCCYPSATIAARVHFAFFLAAWRGVHVASLPQQDREAGGLLPMSSEATEPVHTAATWTSDSSRGLAAPSRCERACHPPQVTFCRTRRVPFTKQETPTFVFAARRARRPLSILYNAFKLMPEKRKKKKKRAHELSRRRANAVASTPPGQKRTPQGTPPQSAACRQSRKTAAAAIMRQGRDITAKTVSHKEKKEHTPH